MPPHHSQHWKSFVICSDLQSFMQPALLSLPDFALFFPLYHSLWVSTKNKVPQVPGWKYESGSVHAHALKKHFPAKSNVHLCVPKGESIFWEFEAIFVYPICSVARTLNRGPRDPSANQIPRSPPGWFGAPEVGAQRGPHCPLPRKWRWWWASSWTRCSCWLISICSTLAWPKHTSYAFLPDF